MFIPTESQCIVYTARCVGRRHLFWLLLLFLFQYDNFGLFPRAVFCCRTSKSYQQKIQKRSKQAISLKKNGGINGKIFYFVYLTITYALKTFPQYFFVCNV